MLLFGLKMKNIISPPKNSLDFILTHLERRIAKMREENALMFPDVCVNSQEDDDEHIEGNDHERPALYWF